MATITDRTVVLAEFTHTEAGALAEAIGFALVTYKDKGKGTTNTETIKFLSALYADLVVYT